MVTKPWEKYYSDDARRFDPNEIAAPTISRFIAQVAGRFGDRTTVTTILPTRAEASLTYAQLHAHSDAFAAYLREELGLQAGDTVAIMSPNCIGFCVASLGIAKAGCVGTNVNPLYTASEFEHQLSDSNVKAVVIIDIFGNKLDEVVAKTRVQHVITLSVVDFFPPLKKAILSFVLKRVRKVIPTMITAHTRMADALARGQRHVAGRDMGAYTDNITSDQTALYQYTSGTTGRNKGAELSHIAILANMDRRV